MFSEQSQQVNIRRLRGGRIHLAAVESLAGMHLHLRLPPGTEDGAFDAGELVEVNTPETLYLGEIASRLDTLVIVAVEHALERKALAAIREVWHSPDGS